MRHAKHVFVSLTPRLWDVIMTLVQGKASDPPTVPSSHRGHRGAVPCSVHLGPVGTSKGLAAAERSYRLLPGALPPSCLRPGFTQFSAAACFPALLPTSHTSWEEPSKSQFFPSRCQLFLRIQVCEKVLSFSSASFL